MKEKLKTRDILAYAVGSIGDSTVYNFVLSFFSFFMTTVAGVSPAVAGTIISIAIAWDAITDPIIGYLVDHSKSKYGKRRPWILSSLVPMGASLVLMFLNVNFDQTEKNLYYLVLVLVFWSGYTAFNIPYYSFGSVLTESDSERVKLAAYREVLGYVGIFCASSVPTFIVGYLVKKGFENGYAWTIAATVAAVVSTVSIFLMWKFTRGKERMDEQVDVEKISPRTFVRNIIDLTKMKPYLLIIISALMNNVCMTLYNSSLMYYVTYNMGLSEMAASTMFTCMTVVSIVLIPFVTKAVEKFSKGQVYVSCVVFSGLCMILAKFVHLNSVFMGCVYVVLVGVGTCAYWMCIFTFLYDVVDYDAFNHNKTRDGIIMSYYSFILKLGGSAAAAVQGVLLARSGFVEAAATQSASTLNAIESMFTYIPGICLILSGMAIAFTPLQDKKMDALRSALEKRRKGEEYSTEGFESLIIKK